MRPLVLPLPPGPQHSRGGHICKLTYITARGHSLCPHSHTGTAPAPGTAWAQSSASARHSSWASVPPCAMMYIRPVDSRTGKRRHALLAGPVDRRVNRTGKGTWQTSHPLPLPSRKKPPNSYIQLMGTRY